MIFKQFFGKTIDAALKSAQQMYGNNFIVFDYEDSDNKDEAGITVVAQNKPENREIMNPTGTGGDKPVSFEKTAPEVKADNGFSKELSALRKIAESQIQETVPGKPVRQTESAASKTRFEPVKKKTESQSGKLSTYGRHTIRANFSAPKVKNSELPINKPEPAKKPVSASSLIDRMDTTKPVIEMKPGLLADQPKAQVQNQKKDPELKALHERLQKIESLLDSQLMAANLVYATHPSFQQLIRAGVPHGIVGEWFGRIIKQGIDPYHQTTGFMSELSKILRYAVSPSGVREDSKYKLFTGPGGSGKTTLIMNLLENDQQINRGKTAVVAIIPEEKNRKEYYTIMEPYCRDHQIPFYTLKEGENPGVYQDEWHDAETILIDSPPLHLNQPNSFKTNWDLRQRYSVLQPLEVHFVINIAMSHLYFQNSVSLKYTLQPDYLALTHLDSITQWGRVIPLFEKMGCHAKYMSCRETDSLTAKPFNAEWFVKKVLEKT